MIDEHGYRANVGILIANHAGRLLWAKRIGRNSWQFPQGGIAEGESAKDALFRELYEEIGLKKQDVKILGRTKSWLRYVVPKKFRRRICDDDPICIGQKQKWFILRLTGGEDKINLAAHHTPEFDGWRWIKYWDCLSEAVYFKRAVYRSALHDFAHLIVPKNERRNPTG